MREADGDCGQAEAWVLQRLPREAAEELGGGAAHHGLYGKLEEALDVGFDVDGGEGAAVAPEGLSLWPNEELLKVPGHV